MSEIYVEVTKEHLGQVKEIFDRRLVRFLIDFRQRRISYVMEHHNGKPKSWFGLVVAPLPITRLEAEMIYDNDPDEQSLARQIMGGVDRIKEIFVTAAAAPAGTKFLVTMEDYKWFLPEGETA